MNTRPSSQPGWVWIALTLQFLILLSIAPTLSVLTSSSFYSAYGAQSLSIAIRLLVPAGFAGVPLIGLWRTQRWGWILAVLVDGAMSAEVLLTLPQHGVPTFWEPTSLAKFGALVVLLNRPVRTHFFGLKSPLVRAIPWPRLPAVPAGVRYQADRLMRVYVYFAVAVVATCVAAAFMFSFFAVGMAVGMKEITGTAYILIIYFFYLGWAPAGVASILFALILTMLLRRLGPGRRWVWLLIGGTLAPGLIVVLGLIGPPFFPVAPSTIGFLRPEYLGKILWVTAPTGVFTARICYGLYPWSFLQAPKTSNAADGWPGRQVRK